MSVLPRRWLLGLAFAAAAIASAAAMAADAPVAEPIIVRIEKYTFVPAELTVPVGATVRWQNDEKRTSHSIWFEREGVAESPRLFPGETFERTFTAPGRYDYRCGPHEEMHGVIIVVER